MHGYIWVESTGIQGEGCTFYVALPCSAQKAPVIDAEDECASLFEAWDGGPSC